MKAYRSLLLSLLLASPFAVFAADSLDDVTMDVVKHNDSKEVTNEIKLPEAMEKETHDHDGKNGQHAKDDVAESKEHAEDSKEHAAESKESAEESKDSSHEAATQGQSDMK